jgi:hypothetical protein
MPEYVWPQGLPATGVGDGNYTETEPSNFLKTEMDSGAEKLRRKFTSMPVQCAARFAMHISQSELLRQFKEVVGPNPFWWFSHRNIDGIALFRFADSEIQRSYIGNFHWRESVGFQRLPNSEVILPSQSVDELRKLMNVTKPI